MKSFRLRCLFLAPAVSKAGHALSAVSLPYQVLGLQEQAAFGSSLFSGSVKQ